MITKQRTELIRNIIRQYPELPKLTIARYILNHHGSMFDHNLEAIRSAIRYHCGQNGNTCRKLIGDKIIPKDHVNMPPTWAPVRDKYHLNHGKWLSIMDIHVPFHETIPLESALQFGQKEKINGIFINGDAFEADSMSFWPGIRRDFDREVEAFVDFLDFLIQEFPKAKIVYKPGNHEYRLPRYFQRNAKILEKSPLATMETLMGFETRGIEFLDYFQIVMAGKLPILHGHEIRGTSRAVNPARGLFLKAKTFSLCGHFHSTSQHSTRDLMGNLITTWSTGCLCNLEPEWNPYGNDWNWGFAIITIDKNEDFEVANYRILPNGHVVK
jgi:hypothetical protein